MKSKKFRKLLFVILLIIVFVLGIVLGNIIQKNSSNTAVESTKTTKVVEVEVGTQTIENTLTSSGEIAASETEKISLTTTKYFETMCVEEADIVKAGGNILEYTDGTYLTAEYDCLISSYSVPETESKCTSSNYVEIKNLSTMAMNISVSETDINKVAKGQEVSIEISAIDDKTYTGTIKSINNAGTYSSSGTTFSAVVEFANDGDVKVGMSASCSIVLEKAENCIAVPIDAVQTTGDQKYVVVVNNDGTTQNVNIETGISNSSYVQITSGLSGGETIQKTEIVTTNNSSSDGNGKMNFDKSQMNFDKSQMPSDMQMPTEN